MADIAEPLVVGIDVIMHGVAPQVDLAVAIRFIHHFHEAIGRRLFRQARREESSITVHFEGIHSAQVPTGLRLL